LEGKSIKNEKYTVKGKGGYPSSGFDRYYSGNAE
jgi:hypothetical protein